MECFEIKLESYKIYIHRYGQLLILSILVMYIYNIEFFLGILLDYFGICILVMYLTKKNVLNEFKYLVYKLFVY